MTTTKLLFSHNWNVRLSDPGEEGAHSHLFETTKVRLEALLTQPVSYVFTKQVEDRVEIQHTFDDLTLLFKFLSDYLDPVALALLGVEIGRSNLA